MTPRRDVACLIQALVPPAPSARPYLQPALLRLFGSPEMQLLQSSRTLPLQAYFFLDIRTV